MKTTTKTVKSNKRAVLASVRDGVAAAVSGLAGKAAKAAAKLAEAMKTCPLVRWQLAHGKLGRQDTKFITAMALMPADKVQDAIRASACLLNEVLQAGLHNVPAGRVMDSKARAFPSGSLMLSLKGTALGAVMADEWWKAAERSGADIMAGRKPAELLIPFSAGETGRSKHGTAGHPLRYSPAMARAACKLAGVDIAKLSADEIAAKIDIMTIAAVVKPAKAAPLAKAA